MSCAGKPARPPAAGPRRPPASTSALLTLGYAVAVYLLFLAVLCYAAGFFADIGVPRGSTRGRVRRRRPRSRSTQP